LRQRALQKLGEPRNAAAQSRMRTGRSGSSVHRFGAVK
jgi:hypothetical protein